jgi:hemerythrin-like metal-binding protein
MQTPATPRLPWSEALELGLDFMDDTHREFVDLLARCEAAADPALPAIWDELVAHTAAHFGREDTWMQSTGFASGNCHTVQHRVVLQVLREGAARAAEGNLAPVRQMIGELAVWFPQHAQSMDAALALHLRSVGYDPESGRVRIPAALPAAEIQGCGGACSSTTPTG